jgi:hypothetical protein
LAHYQDAGLRPDEASQGEPRELALRPFTLTAAERRELIAFLRSLTDPTFMAGLNGERTNSLSR